MESIDFPIKISDRALTEVLRLKSQEMSQAMSQLEGANSIRLRVQVVGGGCSGMSYKLGFDKDALGANDKVITLKGVELVIDAKSLLFLSGTELDFSDGLNGKGFVFNNPNAKRTCGCGNSFSA